MYKASKCLSAYLAPSHFEKAKSIVNELISVRKEAIAMFGTYQAGKLSLYEHTLKDINLIVFSANKDAIKVYCYDLTMAIAKLDILKRSVVITSDAYSVKLFNTFYSAYVGLKAIRQELFDIW